MKTLFIDTSDNREIRVGIKLDDKEDMIVQQSDHWKAQAVLPLIDQLLRKYLLSINDIESIEVNPGPGSFTGLRVGVAIANALGTWLQIPVNGKKIGEIIDPIYT